MRTTVTLDPDTESIVRRLMSQQGLSFKAAINQAIRSAAAPSSTEQVTVTARRMGPAAVDLDHALSLVGDLEDAEMLRKIAQRR